MVNINKDLDFSYGKRSQKDEIKVYFNEEVYEHESE